MHAWIHVCMYVCTYSNVGAFAVVRVDSKRKTRVAWIAWITCRPFKNDGDVFRNFLKATRQSREWFVNAWLSGSYINLMCSPWRNFVMNSLFWISIAAGSPSWARNPRRTMGRMVRFIPGLGRWKIGFDYLVLVVNGLLGRKGKWTVSRGRM